MNLLLYVYRRLKEIFPSLFGALIVLTMGLLIFNYFSVPAEEKFPDEKKVVKPPARVEDEDVGVVYNNGQDVVYIFEDALRNVTCYVYKGMNKGGISCLNN